MEIRIQVGKILGNLEKDIEKKMEKMGLVALEESQFLCPVDTGKLKKSLKVKTERVEKNIVETTLSTDVHYAPYVEFGTGRRGNYPYSDELGLDLRYGIIAGQVAQPYMYPAIKKAIGEMTHVLT
jgi:hypothetical protein